MKTHNEGERDLLAAVLAQAIEDIRVEKPKWKPPTIEEHRERLKRRKGMRKTLFADFEANRLKNHRDTVIQWRMIKEQALGWIKSRSNDHLFTFESICTHLDIDANVVRRKLGLR